MAARVERKRMRATQPEFSAILPGANIYDGKTGRVSSAAIGNAQALLWPRTAACRLERCRLRLRAVVAHAAVRLWRGNDGLIGGAAAAIAGAWPVPWCSPRARMPL